MKNEVDGEIQETDELIEESLTKLRQLIAGEKALSCPNERHFLLKFLRTRKYNVDATFANVQKYFKVREEVGEIFDDFCPSAVLYDAVCRKHQVALLSRERDPFGRAVLLVRTGRWNASVCTAHEFVKICLLLLEWSLLDEEVQKRGFVFVLDYKGLSLEHLYHLTPPFMKRLVHITEKCLPVRVKAIYVIYDSLIFDVLFAITKPFMSRTLTERIHLIGCEHQKLHGVVPADVIPEEAGGTLESYDYDELEKDLLSQSQYFEYIGLHGYGKENTEF
uniref:Putative phosphatidylinositol transfer protein sec14 n=1 Tax=Hyalomma excavatum TaxID=257692 RepID=A0A131XAX5_9ACAR